MKREREVLIHKFELYIFLVHHFFSHTQYHYITHMYVFRNTLYHKLWKKKQHNQHTHTPLTQQPGNNIFTIIGFKIKTNKRQYSSKSDRGEPSEGVCEVEDGDEDGGDGCNGGGGPIVHKAASVIASVIAKPAYVLPP